MQYFNVKFAIVHSKVEFNIRMNYLYMKKKCFKTKFIKTFL